MRLLNLADRLRDAGVEVVETRGWKTRGYAFAAKPKVVVGHHTASSPKGGAMPSLSILINGRSDLPGPLCQVGLSRNGVAYVVASGKANHAGPGRWKDVQTSALTVGIEAENSGVGEPWPADQLDAFDKCAAVLLDVLGQPAAMYCGHREWAVPTGRKIDPHGIDLDQQRGRIHRLLTEGFDMPSAEEVARAILNSEVDDGLTVRLALRRNYRRIDKLVDMVAKVGAGDGASAVEIREELARALKE